MTGKDGLENQKNINKELSATDRALLEAAKKTVQLTEESRTLTEELKDQLNIRSKTNEGEKTLLSLSRDITKSAQENKVALRETGDISKQLIKDQKNLDAAKREQLILEQTIGKENIDQAKAIASRAKAIQTNNAKILQMENEIANQKGGATKEQLKLLENQKVSLRLNEAGLKASLTGATAEAQRLALVNGLVTAAEENVVNSEEQKAAQDRINKSLGIAGKLAGAFKQSFGGIASAIGIDKVADDMKKFATEAEDAGKSVSRLQVLGVGMVSAFKGLGNTLTDPSFLLTNLIKALVTSDKQTGELAKSFGNSYSEALSLRNELNTIANLSGDINITTASLQKSLVAINKEFGTAAMLNGELLKDYTQLTEVAGYTNEAAAGLSKITLATGGDLSDNTSQILGQAVAFNAVNGLALNEKEIVEGVAKASSAATLSLGMQPKAIANAVIQAKALGTSLEKVEQIASSLLDFESSIQNELEAELLTGKAINLEVAREAALRGDLATVASEISNQIGTAADFTKMDVRAQEALAKSVGMTKNELADSLMQREALARIGMEDKTALEAYNELKKQNLSDEQIATKLGDEKLAAQLKSQSTQEKFAASMEKLQEIFVTIASPILEIVTPFAEIISMVAGLAGGIGPFIKYLAIGYGILKGTQLTLQGILAISKIISIIKKADVGWETSILTTLGLQNAARAFSLTQQTTGSTLTAILAALNQTILGSIIAQGTGLIRNIARLGTQLALTTYRALAESTILGSITAQGAGLIRNIARLGTQLALTTYRALAESTILGSIIAQGAGLIRNIARLGTQLAVNLANAAAALTANAAITFGVGAAIAVGAALAGYAAIKAITADDMISSPSGYGSRTLMGPEGAIALNNKDTVIAGTNLFPEGDTKEDTLMSSPSMPSINLEPLIQEMQGLKDGIERLITLVSEGGDVYIDGTKVGKTLSLVTSKMG
jgi:hypothetical protein